MTPWAEAVQSLAIHEKHRLLRLVHNQLAPRVEILARMFPDKRAVVPLVLDDLDNR